MKIKTTLFLFTVMTITTLWSLGCAPAVTFKLKVDKRKYLVGEPVWIHIYLRNNSPNELVRIITGELDAGLKIKNSQGVQLQPALICGFLISDNDRLSQGDSLWTQLDLTDRFWPRYDDFSLSAFPPDIYTVYSEINVHYDRSTGLKSQVLKSNELKFRVVEPKGTEEDAIQLLNLSYKESDNKNRDKSIEYLEEFIARYPKSVYLETAYRSLITKYLFKNRNDELILKYSRQLIGVIPNSYEVQYAMSNVQEIYRKNSDPQGARTIFEEIVRTHPGTKAAIVAQWQISLIDNLPLDKWIEFEFSKKQLKKMGLEPPKL